MKCLGWWNVREKREKMEERYLRSRSLNDELVTDTCEARDAPSEGLERVPAQTQLHFSPLCLLSVSLCVERERANTHIQWVGALAGRASDFVLVRLNQGRARKKVAHQMVSPKGHGWSRIN